MNWQVNLKIQICDLRKFKKEMNNAQGQSGVRVILTIYTVSDSQKNIEYFLFQN